MPQDDQDDQAQVDHGEAFYDKEIAPRLLEIGELCKGRGMSIAASVEFAPGEVGLTLHSDDLHACGPQFRLAAYGVRCRGNIDNLIGSLFADDKRHAGPHGTNSVYLKVLDRATSEDDEHKPGHAREPAPRPR